MKVKCFRHLAFTSNTYLIFRDSDIDAFLIDVGEYSECKGFLKKNNLRIKALFLTHGHYDHIYGIRALLSDFPTCSVFADEYTLKSLLDPKLNLSFYHEDPFFLSAPLGIPLDQDDAINLFPDVKLFIYPTPGHNPGCISFKLGNCLFTGDSYIPFIPVVTKLKGGNREENLQSLKKIKKLIEYDTIIFPGHGNSYIGKEVLNQDELLVV